MIETLVIIRTKNEDRWLKATLEKIEADYITAATEKGLL